MFKNRPGSNIQAQNLNGKKKKKSKQLQRKTTCKETKKEQKSQNYQEKRSLDENK